MLWKGHTSDYDIADIKREGSSSDYAVSEIRQEMSFFLRFCTRKRSETYTNNKPKQNALQQALREWFDEIQLLTNDPAGQPIHFMIRSVIDTFRKYQQWLDELTGVATKPIVYRASLLWQCKVWAKSAMQRIWTRRRNVFLNSGFWTEITFSWKT